VFLRFVRQLTLLIHLTFPKFGTLEKLIVIQLPNHEEYLLAKSMRIGVINNKRFKTNYMNKQDLINKIKQLEGLTHDERADLINLLNTKKKYGLIWEDKHEDAEEEMRTQLPVLKEVVEKRILSESVKLSEPEFYRIRE
jgi:hypothetical protein